MFQFTGFPPGWLYIHHRVTWVLQAGFPHSDIAGSSPAYGFPALFAVCHVLRRLLTPRHPPFAFSRFVSIMRRHRCYFFFCFSAAFAFSSFRFLEFSKTLHVFRSFFCVSDTRKNSMSMLVLPQAKVRFRTASARPLTVKLTLWVSYLGISHCITAEAVLPCVFPRLEKYHISDIFSGVKTLFLPTHQFSFCYSLVNSGLPSGTPLASGQGGRNSLACACELLL